MRDVEWYIQYIFDKHFPELSPHRGRAYALAVAKYTLRYECDIDVKTENEMLRKVYEALLKGEEQ